MSDLKTSTLLALSLISSPMASPLNGSLDKNTSLKVANSSFVSSSERTAKRRMKYQLAAAPLLKPKGTYVGELQEKWQFPSDHLPIGMTFDNLNIASWNVLDAEYISWVLEKNSQGLSRSMIADEHVYIGDSKLTIRDQHVIDLVLEMINHPTHRRDMIALQECSSSFIEELRARLPSYCEIISHHGECLIYDRRFFELYSTQTPSGIFTNEPERTIQDITLRRLETQELFRIVNIHLPGDPTKPGRFEFGQYLAKTFDPAVTTLAMGDMNFNELEMADAMEKAFAAPSPFSLHSPYCTNISPFVFNSKAIDHFIVYSPTNASLTLSNPNEVLSNLSSTVDLLEIR